MKTLLRSDPFSHWKQWVKGIIFKSIWRHQTSKTTAACGPDIPERRWKLWDKLPLSCLWPSRYLLIHKGREASLLAQGKESTWRYRRCGFGPWFRKITWARKWKPTPVFLSGESHGQRSLVGYKSIGLQRVRHHLASKQQQKLRDWKPSKEQQQWPKVLSRVNHRLRD